MLFSKIKVIRRKATNTYLIHLDDLKIELFIITWHEITKATFCDIRCMHLIEFDLARFPETAKIRKKIPMTDTIFFEKGMPGMP